MKVPEPRRLSNGDWYIYLRLNGKGIPVQDSNKAACKAKAASIKARYKAGELDIKPPTEKDTTTLGAVLDAYIAKYEPVLSPATVRGYGIIRRNRFKSEMEELVDAIDFQQMVNHELKVASPKTVKNAWGLIGSVLKDSGRAVPSVRCAPVPVKDLPFLQPEEIGPFLKAIEGDRAEVALLLELNGLRYSEVRALTAKSIDLKAGTIMVSGAVVPGKDHKFTAKPTNKNKTSSRTVPILIPRLKAILESSGGLQPEMAQIHSLVTQRHAQAACVKAGVTSVGNHDLRRSFVSLCRFMEVPEEQAMAWGGWSDYYTMHKHYIKTAEKTKSVSAEKMSLFFQNANNFANKERER